MRFGVVIDPGWGWATQRDTARRAEELGFDLVWIEAGNAIMASALAGVTTSIHVGLRLAAGPHPVHLAEEAAVADLLLGGRLVLAIGAGDGGIGQLEETLEVLLAAQAPRPFGHDGPQWKIPGNLPDNVETERRVRVTPTPARIESPVWVSGDGTDAAKVAAEFGVSFVGGPGDTPDMAATWSTIEAAIGPAAARLHRPAVRRLQNGFDPGAALASLEAERRAWGMDMAILAAPVAALEELWSLSRDNARS